MATNAIPIGPLGASRKRGRVSQSSHAQLRVSKLSDGANTRTRVAQLTADERVEELARMLGGQKITQATRDHAAEMLEKAG